MLVYVDVDNDNIPIVRLEEGDDIDQFYGLVTHPEILAIRQEGLWSLALDWYIDNGFVRTYHVPFGGI